jgi:methionyl aminopeptidase
MENIVIDHEDWIKAGKIAAEALQYGKTLIVKGASMIDVLNKIEFKIKELGGECSFPPQISMDNCAAHFCPNEEDVVFDKQVCSLDVGAHVNGAQGDNALTVDLSGEYSKLVEASEKAVEEAIKLVKPGVTLGEIGAVVQRTIQSFGFSPVKNLSGHGMSRFNIHSWPTVPNYDNGDQTKLEENMVIAIEPFATDGTGLIHEGGKATLFAQVKKGAVRSLYARDILKKIIPFNGLPFASRWLSMHPLKLNSGLKELLGNGILEQFQPLMENGKGVCTQAEHTVLVTETGCKVLTKL